MFFAITRPEHATRSMIAGWCQRAEPWCERAGEIGLDDRTTKSLKAEIKARIAKLLR